MSETSHRPARKPLNLGIANFKAFGPHPQNIPLKPITLVFGPNSGGKSSLLHYLLWLKDIISPPHGRENPLDVYWPSAGDANVELNGSRQGVDLGGFKQFRHGSDARAEVQNRMHLLLKFHEEKMPVEVVSHFASSLPPTNYHARLRAMAKERLEDSRQRNSLDKLVKFGTTLAKKMTKELLTKLIVAEDKNQEYPLKRWLEAVLEEKEYPYADVGRVEVPDFSAVFAAECPKLSQAAKDDPLKELDFVVRDESPLYGKPPTEEEMIAELQNLVCRMFDEFNFKPLQASEAERPSLVRFEIRSGGSVLLLAARNEASELELLELDMEAAGQLLGRSKDQGDAPSRYEREKSDFRVVFDDASSWLPRDPRMETDILEETPAHKAVLKLLKEDEFDEMLSLNKKGLMDLCEYAAKVKLCSMSYLGPIRAYPSRDIKVADLPESKDSHGWFAWRRLALIPPLRDSVNAWLKEQNYSLQITAGHNAVLETFGQDMCSQALERIKRIQEAAKYQEDLEQSTTGWNLLDWNAEADLQNSLEAAASAITSEASKTVFLKDAKTGKTVSCRDIGVGISQLIPVLVQAMDSQNEIIVMEQPELHLHPRLQAELGDVFIESALGRGNTFVLETHSEHLILRLLRRIRETTEGELPPDGKYALTPDQICVLYVEPGEQGSKILKLPVTPDGDFSRPWPQGFFEERSAELF